MTERGRIFMNTRVADTVVVIAPGWSLTKEQCDMAINSHATTIAIGDSYKLAPEADILYHADVRWWEHHLAAVKDLKSKKVGVAIENPRKGRIDVDSPAHLGIDVLLGHMEENFNLIPGHINLGTSSGYQALNLALHFYPRKIILLGFDLCLDPREGENHGKAHFDGDHQGKLFARSAYQNFIEWFCSSAEFLANLGISVYNCNEHSALECFDKVGLAECLKK